MRLGTADIKDITGHWCINMITAKAVAVAAKGFDWQLLSSASTLKQGAQREAFFRRACAPHSQEYDPALMVAFAPKGEFLGGPNHVPAGPGAARVDRLRLRRLRSVGRKCRRAEAAVRAPTAAGHASRGGAARVVRGDRGWKWRVLAERRKWTGAHASFDCGTVTGSVNGTSPPT